MKRESIEEKAARLGLYVATWSPGDGATRYKIADHPFDYHDGTEICTTLGRAETNTWLNGYGWALELQRRGGKL